MAVLTWIVAIPLLGVGTGMRTFTPLAVVSWFAYLGYLPLDDTWMVWLTRLTAVIVLTLLAAGEIFWDKRPGIPDRTSIGPLLARLIVGGLIGGTVAMSLNGSGIEGTLLGIGGALIGAFGGHLVRREIVEKTAGKDWPVALAEDVVTIGFAVVAMGIVTG
ncbi:MAG TPA: DUF4126 family protein [Edaphobacter sp.]|nr:DUF4126 family protein [Edaphobacter sp.]